jgi:hypothetical protein
MRMRLNKAGRLGVLLAAVSLATTVAAPLPSAGAATAAKKTAKQMKALKQQVASLTGLATALQAKIASLEADRSAPAPSLTRAGGDLVGAYPDPQIRTGAIVGSDIADGTIFGRHIATQTISAANIADDAVGSAEIADGAISKDDLRQFSVGASQLAGAFIVSSFPNPVGGNNAVGGNEATCPGGSRLLSGGVEWDSTAGSLTVITSGPSQLSPNTSWEVAGHNSSGQVHSIMAKALCLRAQP